MATVILGGLVTSTFREFVIHPGLFWRFTARDAGRLVAPWHGAEELTKGPDRRSGGA